MSVALLAAAAVASAQDAPKLYSVTFHWKPGAGGFPASGYKMFRRKDPSIPFSKAEQIDVKLGTSNTDGTISAVVPGFDPAVVWFVSMRAYNAAGESDQSNEVTWPRVPSPVELIDLAIDQAQQLTEQLRLVRDRVKPAK